jgi:hypothetical protein
MNLTSFSTFSGKLTSGCFASTTGSSLTTSSTFSSSSVISCIGDVTSSFFSSVGFSVVSLMFSLETSSLTGDSSRTSTSSVVCS